MSLFFYDDHADNPPATWQVVKVADRCWHLTDKAGTTMQSCKTRREAEALKVSGWLVRMYDQESRWYAGERITEMPGACWKPFTPDVLEGQRRVVAQRKGTNR